MDNYLPSEWSFGRSKDFHTRLRQIRCWVRPQWNQSTHTHHITYRAFWDRRTGRIALLVFLTMIPAPRCKVQAAHYSTFIVCHMQLSGPRVCQQTHPLPSPARADVSLVHRIPYFTTFLTVPTPSQRPANPCPWNSPECLVGIHPLICFLFFPGSSALGCFSTVRSVAPREHSVSAPPAPTIYAYWVSRYGANQAVQRNILASVLCLRTERSHFCRTIPWI